MLLHSCKQLFGWFCYRLFHVREVNNRLPTKEAIHVLAEGAIRHHQYLLNKLVAQHISPEWEVFGFGSPGFQYFPNYFTILAKQVLCYGRLTRDYHVRLVFVLQVYLYLLPSLTKWMSVCKNALFHCTYLNCFCFSGWKNRLFWNPMKNVLSGIKLTGFAEQWLSNYLIL